MPSFSPKIESTGIPNFDVGGGEALSTLFQGLGNTIGSIASVADQAIQNRIKRDSQSMFEEVNKPFTDIADAPDDIQNVEESFSRLRDAKQQGKLTDTAYYSKLVSETKRLKNKYPGYGDVVDATIQSVTGTRPANALRNAILAEIDAEEAQVQRREKDWADFLDNKGNQEAIGAQYPDLFTNPERYSSDEKRAEVRSAALRYNGKMGELGMIKSQLAVDKDSYEANKININQKTNGYIGFKVAEDISGLNRMLENEYGSNLYTTLSNISSGKLKLDPMEQQQLIGQIKLKRDALYNNLMLEINNSTNGFMPPDDVKKLLDASMAPYDTILGSMQEGKWDIAGMHSRAIKEIQERSLHDLLKNNGQIVLMGSLEKASPALAQKVAQEPSIGKLTMTLAEILASNMNGSDATSLAEELKNLASSNNINESEKASGMKYSLDLLTTQLSDPQGDPESFKKVFERTYNDNNIFKNVGDRSQIEVFTKLTDPKITQKIVQSGDKKMLQDYYNWSISQFQSLSDFRRMAADVNSVQETGNFMSAEVGDNGKLQLYINAEEFNTWASTTAGLNKTVMVRAMRDTINNFEKFNTAFSGVVPIMEAMGVDIPNEMSRILANTGVNLDAREESWMMWLSEAITGENVPDREIVDQLTPFKEFLAKNPEWLQVSLNYENVKTGFQQASYRDAIAKIESQGTGDYNAIGVADPKLGRPLGRYQIMEANLGQWSKEALGRSITAEEFLANPQLQDRIFDKKFNSYVSKYGLEGAAQAWLGGPGSVNKTDRKDVHGTSVGDYGKKFMENLSANKSGEMISSGKGLAALTTSNKRGYTPDVANLRPELAKGVEALQTTWGRPLPIISGYRDPARNKRAGGAKKSQHMHGNAVDIDVSDLSIEERKALIRMASEQGFTGIGVYTNSLHLDKGNKRYWGPSYSSRSLPKWASGVIQEHMNR